MQDKTKVNIDTTPIILDSLSTSPQSIGRKWNVTDPVAIINSAGSFKIDCTIEDEKFNLIKLSIPYAKTREHRWVTADERYQYTTSAQVLASMPHGYKIRIGSGRLTYNDWILPQQIFPVPWQNNMQVKIGDSVYIRRSGNFEKTRAVITGVPTVAGGRFSVTYIGYSGKYLVDYKDVYTSIEPATINLIKAGDILYFENMYWVMVIDVKDSNRVIIRNEGFPATDKIVSLTSLQILK